jgi:colicin import membrane protein
MTDYTKIQEQIEAAKKAQITSELELMAAATARLEAARMENEKRRIAEEKAREEAIQAHIEKRRKAQEAAEELQRAETVRQRVEEHKINLAQEAKAQEERQAEELKKKIANLQFQHEQAMKALKDSYDMSSTAEAFTPSAEGQVTPDGTVQKRVTNNTDGAVNPLKQHLHAVNN